MLTDPGKLEIEINEWLEAQGENIEITKRLMAASGRHSNIVTVTIFYKEGEEESK